MRKYIIFTYWQLKQTRMQYYYKCSMSKLLQVINSQIKLFLQP